VARAALALGGVAATPFRVSQAERALVGQSERAMFARAAQAADDADALNDPAFPGWYRRRLAVALLVKAIDGAYARAIAGPTS
jgi:carbon-monoxide dehydrogenase medium subunit